MNPVVNVFAAMHPVLRRSGTSGYRMQLVSRGHGTVMYQTAVQDSEGEAVRLAKQYLRRNKDRLQDTTNVEASATGWRQMWRDVL